MPTSLNPLPDASPGALSLANVYSGRPCQVTWVTPVSGRVMVPSCAAPVGVLPLATVSGCHSDRHEALPPGIIELAVQMKLPPRSADSVYRVMPLWLTSTLVPSLELFALCTVVLADPPPPLVPAADIEPQPAASATAATSPASVVIRIFMIPPRIGCDVCMSRVRRGGSGGIVWQHANRSWPANVPAGIRLLPYPVRKPADLAS